ncbi:MAG: VIT and VWA domain-containing protein [Planctomycetota bacterium]
MMTTIRRVVPLLAMLCTASLSAQGLLIGPDPASAQTAGGSDSDSGDRGAATAPRPTRAGVHIVKTGVKARIVDGVATTTIEQTIANTTSRIQEATWFMPLPAGAVADAFTMTVGGKEIAGEVLDSGKARQIYESIVRRRRDPGLLEYAGEGMLRARIFPIPAQGEIGIMVRMRQVMEPKAGMYEWNWPVRVARLGDAAAGMLSLDLAIESKTPIATVVSPHGDAEIRRIGQNKARVSLEGANGDFDDLRVLYGLTKKEFGLNALTWRKAGEPGYFTLLVSPPRELAEGKLPPRLVQFVIDTSGSMKGAKINQAKASVHAFLGSLRDSDYFQVHTFASTVTSFFDEPQRATVANLAEARRRIYDVVAMGGTNIGEALREALTANVPEGNEGLLPQIVFVTDGQPSVGLTDANKILALLRETENRVGRGVKPRLFALGVGDRVDARLIDDLVEQHRGARDFVGDNEKIEVKVDALCQKLSRPALADVVVSCDGLDAFHVHPNKTRDLFCGDMMQVVGRYRNHGKHTVRVRGKQAGVEKDYSFEVAFPETASDHEFAQTLWAKQHVASLLVAIRRNGVQAELVDEVRQLATRYGIVTPYTSQLIVEEGMRLAFPTGTSSNRPVRYRGPGSVVPPIPGRDQGGWGGGTGRPRGPAASGPASAGATGPTGPATSGGGSLFERLGQARTGPGAVAESKSLSGPVTGSDDFYLGATRNPRTSRRSGSIALPELRRANGRVFLVTRHVVVEQGLPTDWRKQAVVVVAYSDEYFALLRQQPKLRAIFALGDRVAFRDGKRIVRITTRAPARKPVRPTAPAAKQPGVAPSKSAPQAGSAGK